MAIKLSEFGSHNFIAHDAWEQFVIDNQIQNPFKALEALRSEYMTYVSHPDGSTDIFIDDMTEEQKIREKKIKKDRDEFIVKRDIWIGNYLLENFGYDDLTKFAQTQYQGETAFQHWFGQVRPCQGLNGACNMFCPIFNSCVKAQTQIKEI